MGCAGHSWCCSGRRQRRLPSQPRERRPGKVQSPRPSRPAAATSCWRPPFGEAPRPSSPGLVPQAAGCGSTSAGPRGRPGPAASAPRRAQVVAQGDGWFCEHDGQTYPAMVRRYVMQARVCDASGEGTLSVFDDQARRQVPCRLLGRRDAQGCHNPYMAALHCPSTHFQYTMRICATCRMFIAHISSAVTGPCMHVRHVMVQELMNKFNSLRARAGARAAGQDGGRGGAAEGGARPQALRGAARARRLGRVAAARAVAHAVRALCPRTKTALWTAQFTPLSSSSAELLKRLRALHCGVHTSRECSEARAGCQLNSETHRVQGLSFERAWLPFGHSTITTCIRAIH